MPRLLLVCILIAGCADVGETLDGPQRQSGDAALADPFGYGPDIEQLAAEHSAKAESGAEAPLIEKDPSERTLAEEWRLFLNP
ncbi:MAG: hypothetical protein AAGD32_11105 [Planctomycetota bacterium]